MKVPIHPRGADGAVTDQFLFAGHFWDGSLESRLSLLYSVTRGPGIMHDNSWTGPLQRSTRLSALRTGRVIASTTRHRLES